MSVPHPKKQPFAQIVPLHGLSDDWHPILAEDTEYHETYPGYITSKNGPKMDDAKLTEIQTGIRRQLKEGDSTEESKEFHGDASDQNVFARLIRGEIPQWRVWEDPNHVAFFTPFPNFPGFTVLIPRRHLSSDIFRSVDALL